VDDGPEVEDVDTDAGFGDAEGSAVIAAVEDCSGLVFSTPVEVMAAEAGNVEVMGVVEGMEMSLRRPLCEPAPTVVPFEASRSLISTAMWD
jgi:hypothetical protein